MFFAPPPPPSPPTKKKKVKPYKSHFSLYIARCSLQELVNVMLFAGSQWFPLVSQVPPRHIYRAARCPRTLLPERVVKPKGVKTLSNYNILFLKSIKLQSRFLHSNFVQSSLFIPTFDITTKFVITTI